LIYYESQMTLAAGASVANYFFTANGLFDVNVTGTGHQPMGFDQLMLTYEHYSVVASKVEFTVSNGAALDALRAVVYLSPDTTSITSADRLIENGLLTSVLLYREDVFGSIKSLELNCDVARYFGKPTGNDVTLDDQLTGAAGSNPVELVYFTLGAWNPFVATAVDATFDVIIEYDTIFWEPRKLTTS